GVGDRVRAHRGQTPPDTVARTAPGGDARRSSGVDRRRTPQPLRPPLAAGPAAWIRGMAVLLSRPRLPWAASPVRPRRHPAVAARLGDEHGPPGPHPRARLARPV